MGFIVVMHKMENIIRKVIKMIGDNKEKDCSVLNYKLISRTILEFSQLFRAALSIVKSNVGQLGQRQALALVKHISRVA